MADKYSLISQQLLNEIFKYKNGNLYWKKPTFRSRMKKGNKAGTLTKDGRIIVTVLGKPFMAHRLIFMMFHGYLPMEIDHIDCNQQNNQIENLRAANRSQNSCNRGLMKNNTSGVKGVSWNKNSKKWEASCQIQKKQHKLGYFATIEQAEFAVKSFREQNHGKFARHS